MATDDPEKCPVCERPIEGAPAVAGTIRVNSKRQFQRWLLLCLAMSLLTAAFVIMIRGEQIWLSSTLTMAAVIIASARSLPGVTRGQAIAGGVAFVVPWVVVLAIVWLFVGNSGLPIGAPSRTVTNPGDRTVSLALGDTLLIETPQGGRGAVRFDRMTDDWYISYTSWHALSGSTVLSRPRRGSLAMAHEAGDSDSAPEISFEDYRIYCGPIAFDWLPPTTLTIPDSYKFAVQTSGPEGAPDFGAESLTWHPSHDEPSSHRADALGIP